MRGQRAELLERAGVEQQRQALARRVLAARVLLFDALGAAAQHGAAAHLAQHLQVVGRHLQASATILRRRKAICVCSGNCLGQTSWQPSSVMQPKTPSSSPTTS